MLILFGIHDLGFFISADYTTLISQVFMNVSILLTKQSGYSLRLRKLLHSSARTELLGASVIGDLYLCLWKTSDRTGV